jgi:hypothetical protein
MIAKYDDNGGRIHDDHCFNFINPTMEENSHTGKLEEKENEINIDFSLKGATDILLRMILLTHIIMMS